MKFLFEFTMNTFDFSLLSIVSIAFLGNFQKKKTLRYILVLILAAIMSVINMVGHQSLNGLCSLIFAFFLVAQYGKAKHISLFVAGLFSIINIFSELMGSNLVMLYYKEFDITSFPYSDKWLVALTVYKLILLLIIFILTYRKNIEVNLLPQYFNILLFTIPIASCIIVFSNSRAFSGNSNELVTANIIAPITILYINLIVLIILRRANSMANELVEKSLLEQEIVYKQQYYETLEKDQQELRELRHNINNQILAIKAAIYSSDHIEKSDLLSWGNFSSTIFTENPIANSIIHSKFTIAQKQEITFQADINIPKKINITCGDLGIVLGNLLDNAIEACAYCPNKYILVSMKYLSKCLLIEIKNSADQQSIQSYKMGKSRKGNSLEHGIGLKSVSQIINQYDGNLCVLTGEDFFQVNIMLNDTIG